MTYEQALGLVREALSRVVPDAGFASVGPDEKFRDVLEVDSLDFLEFVEVLSGLTGVRLDEDDYQDLTTLADGARLVAARAGV
ncbi:acyl carrier protein [Streptomyces longispororuber]|uniref:acyl carrier protein n=1 Tax=Streptomyces longispororuber TaxID=68230 RepID=UPI00210A471B|nr:acyl carrier protein [Streptomyces longispororuber]MCQ4205646.1 acyl carrier protein [Streptomyces longispororuber]